MAIPQPSQRVLDFLGKVQASHRARIAFVIDATGSREHAWDNAAQLQSEMFVEAVRLGGLEMQVTYFRGVDEVRSSNWTSDARDAVAGLGVPCFCFQEGPDPDLRQAFTEMARLTRGAYCILNAGAIAQLRDLLRAVAAFAVGGLTALADQRTDSARKLLGQMKK